MNILVVDDNRANRRKIIADITQSGLFTQITEAGDGLEGFKKVSEALPDLILCDVEMPRIDGIRFLQMIRSNEETRDIPVLILSVCADRSIRLKGLTEGANDFVLIPYDPEELIARIKRQLAIRQTEKDLKRRNRELELLTHKDPLTGIFNRRYLSMSLESEIMRQARSGGALSLLMLDIDHFKKINDTYGHPVGDLVLQRVVKRLGENLREYDLLARYGGEEFVVVLPDTTHAEAEIVAQRLLQQVRKLDFTDTLDGTTVTISIGVTGHSGSSRIHAADLLLRADTALYRAKQNGRNRVVSFENGVRSVSEAA